MTVTNDVDTVPHVKNYSVQEVLLLYSGIRRAVFRKHYLGYLRSATVITVSHLARLWY